jgi:transcriptional regulator with XRE-family HTH domain
MGGPGEPTDVEGSVSDRETLASLRKRRGLTGVKLGRLVNMSQAKISKIETGRVVPTRDEVRRLARALGVTVEVADDLVERAGGRQDQMTDWRVRSGANRIPEQREIANIESATAEIRIFQDSILPGLLQTAEYARAVLTALRDNELAVGGEVSVEVGGIVSSRIRRQERLADPNRSFIFVMSEAVLRHQICSPIEMASQIKRIRDVAQQDNVTVGILPADQQLRMPHMHGFMLVDDRILLVDLFYTFLTSRGERDLRLYRGIFETMAAQAITDVDAILDRYQDMYLDLARRLRE